MPVIIADGKIPGVLNRLSFRRLHPICLQGGKKLFPIVTRGHTSNLHPEANGVLDLVRIAPQSLLFGPFQNILDGLLGTVNQSKAGKTRFDLLLDLEQKDHSADSGLPNSLDSFSKIERHASTSQNAS